MSPRGVGRTPPVTRAAVRRQVPPGANAAETRSVLLAAAKECFERFGVRRVTMDEIAVAADVSRPTLYRHFGDRDSLIRAIVFDRADRLVEKIHHVVGKEAALADKLITGMLYIVDVGRRDEFISEMLRSDSENVTNPLMVAHGTADVFAEAVWADIFRDAEAAGELPEDFDRSMAYRWLTSVTFMLIGWHDYDDQTLEYKRAMLRRFLAPGFLRGEAGGVTTTSGLSPRPPTAPRP